jgi:hypothetical protein
MPTIGIELQFASFTLDLVKRREVGKAFLGDFAAVIDVQIVKLAARVRHTSRFDHTAIEQRCRRQWFLSNPSLHWTTRAIFLNARKLLIAF